FVVAPHFRLQEWVAEEKGYFAAEGLEYEFREALDSKSGSGHQLGDKVGAYQTLEAGRSSMLALLATGRSTLPPPTVTANSTPSAIPCRPAASLYGRIRR